jgi:hypothetical protein
MMSLVIGYGLAFFLFVTAILLVKRVTAIWAAIIGEVNDQLAEGEKINPQTVAFRFRVFEVLRMHRELFPESNEQKRMWQMTAAYFALGLASALLFYSLGRET